MSNDRQPQPQPPSAMSSPAPLLRPPIPGGRTNSGNRMPRLGLAIPTSANARPVLNGSSAVSEVQPMQRPAPPQLRLATPMGSNTTPQEGRAHTARLPPLQIGGISAGGSSDTSSHSRSGSFGDGHANGSHSAASSAYSALNFVGMLRQPQPNSDPLSAVGSVYSTGGSEGGTAMERENSMGGLPDLEKLSLEKGRALDVEDLDDAGWRAASKDGKIVELGSLGEGAGGAVTRCVLKGGKTVFALKVSDSVCGWFAVP